MAFEREKEKIRMGLEKLRKVPGFEKMLNSPPPMLRHNPLISNSGKNLMASDEFRKHGNELFTQDSHDVCSHYSIIQEYNKSVATSPFPAYTESLALAHGNRSAIFEHLGRYKECISAVDEALALTRTPSLRVKWLCRKAKCCAKVGLSTERTHLSEARFWTSEFEGEETVKKNLAELVSKTENMILKIEFQSPMKLEGGVAKITELISKTELDNRDSTKLVYSEKYGEHLVAARDIRPGEILIREKAFNSCLDKGQAYLYCWHCSSFLWHIVPCNSCASCCYCSDQCRAEAQKHYHEIECDILSIVDTNYMAYSDFCKIICKPVNRLGLKLFLIALKQAGNIRKLKASLESLEENKDIRKFPLNNYRHVYALAGRTSSNNLDNLVMDAALYLVILSKFTSLFYDIFDPDDSDFTLKEFMSNNEILYTGALILKFCAIADSHGFENQRLSDCKQLKPCEEIACGSISWSLGLKTSLTSPSCIPNVKRCLMDKNQITLYAILPIKKGTQIFESHLSIFDDVSKLERQEAFRNRHGFSCDCRACIENWPDINLEGDIREYYSEVGHTLSEKDLKAYQDYLSISNAKNRFSLTERLSKFSELIEYAVEESPLPSKLTAFVIQGFVSFVEKTHGCTRSQMPDKCST